MSQILHQRWLNDCKANTDNEELIHTCWNQLQKLYNHTSRHYHNFDHLLDLFQLFDQYRHLLQTPDQVAFAIWYHDAIYDIPGNDNEERSAALAQQQLTALGYPPKSTRTVFQLIVGTKSHQFDRDFMTPDAAYLYDFDLSTLGVPWDQYQAYSSKIRKEYRIVPEDLYRAGRQLVLQSFLTRERLYWTKPFFEGYEEQARENLSRELEELEVG